MEGSYVQHRAGARRAARALIALAIIAASMAIHAASAQAAFTHVDLRDGNGRAYNCPTWSGGSDGDGNFVIPCGRTMLVLDENGRMLQSVVLPAQLPAFRDAAASHDGQFIYWVTGNLRLDVVTAYPNVGWIHRLRRSADGRYVHDTGFAIPPRQLGANRWGFRNLATDIHGNLYASANAYVYEFGPTGAQRSVFGAQDTYVPAGCGGNMGPCTSGSGIEIAMGIDVHPLGTSVYVSEQRHHHIQRWDRTGPGSPRWTRSNWEIGNRLQGGWNCTGNAVFSSPYDVGLDGNGNVFVLDTSCDRIQRYDAATRAFRGTVAPLAVGGRTHGMAVNFRGHVIVPMPGDNTRVMGRLYRHAPALSGCRPDGDRPVLGPVTTGSTNRARTFNVRIPGRDGCSEVTHMRISGDHRGTQAWVPFRTVVQLTLVRDGVNQLQVTLRDRFGRTSTRTVGIRGRDGATSDGGGGAAGGGAAAPAPAQPRPAPGANRQFGQGRRLRGQVRIWGPPRECVRQPGRFVDTRRYRVLRGCVRIGGRVTSRSNAGHAVNMRLFFGSNLTRRIWVDYPRSAEIWAVGLTSVRGIQAVQPGDRVRMTGALIADRRTGEVSLAPTTFVRVQR